MGHVADRNGGISFSGMGDRHHRGVLEKVVIAAEIEPLAVGFPGLEGGAVERRHLPVLVRDLGALHLDGETFPDPADDVIQEFGVLVDVLGDDVIEVIGGLVFHPVEILVPRHGGDGTDGGDFAAPDASDGETDGGKDAEDPAEGFFHNGQIFLSFPRR